MVGNMGKIFNQRAQKEKRQRLRNDATFAEKLLWQELKGRQLLGYKFRRQHSVGPFVLDFYCPELKLAIEVDGISHDTPEAMEYDRRRQAIIEQYGIRFLRLRDELVKKNTDKALEKIAGEIGHISNNRGRE